MKNKKSIQTVDSFEVQHLAEVALYLQRNFLVLINSMVSKNNMSVPQFTLLSLLADKQLSNMTTLAQIMQHTTPATTGLVDRLHSAGLVERQTTPSDRRQVLVQITDKGTELLNEIKRQIAEAIYNITKTLNPDELKAWIKIYDATYKYFVDLQYIAK